MTADRLDRATAETSEIDVSGSLFGLRIVKRGEGVSDAIEMFVEDDGVWHYKQSFSAFWLDDLIQVCEMAKTALRVRVRLAAQGETDDASE